MVVVVVMMMMMMMIMITIIIVMNDKIYKYIVSKGTDSKLLLSEISKCRNCLSADAKKVCKGIDMKSKKTGVIREFRF